MTYSRHSSRANLASLFWQRRSSPPTEFLNMLGDESKDMSLSGASDDQCKGMSALRPAAACKRVAFQGSKMRRRNGSAVTVK